MVSFDQARGLLPLSSTAFYILVALAQGDCNGATVAKEVEDMTEGAITLPPGTLYRLIKELLADAWIVGSSGSPEVDAATLRAAKASTYLPAEFLCVPISGLFTFRANFAPSH